MAFHRLKHLSFVFLYCTFLAEGILDININNESNTLSVFSLSVIINYSFVSEIFEEKRELANALLILSLSGNEPRTTSNVACYGTGRRRSCFAWKSTLTENVLNWIEIQASPERIGACRKRPRNGNRPALMNGSSVTHFNMTQIVRVTFLNYAIVYGDGETV